MPNTFFRFKQFVIHQQKAAMKVTTDACLFGGLFIRLVGSMQEHTVLDIGTGTGLLSLMYAQQFPLASIDAVEIDVDASEQAAQNFSDSSWSDRISIYSSDILEFDRSYKYDVIISNPPFFENDLKGPNQKRNKALHDHTLTLDQLVNKTNSLMKADGMFLILLPYHRAGYFKSIAIKQGLIATMKSW